MFKRYWAVSKNNDIYDKQYKKNNRLGENICNKYDLKKIFG